MPQETERPVEKLLRAFGKRRREAVGSNFELHPATRRMLQGEVTGQFGTQAAKAQVPERTVWRLWPKLAWGLGACALVIFGIWLLRPKATDSERETLLARNEVQERAAQRAARGLPASVNSMTTPVVELRDQTSTAATNALLLAVAENRPAPILAPPQQRVVETISMENSAQVAKSGTAAVETTRLAAAPEAQKAPAIPSSGQTDQPESAVTAAALPADAAQLNQPGPSPITANDSLEPASSGAPRAIPALSSVTASTAPSSAATLGKDQFAAVFRAVPNQNLNQSMELRAKAGPNGTDSPTAVLASFELEQVGRQLRVIDHDGSVYTGDLQSVPGEGASARTRALVSSGLVRELGQGARPAAAEPGSLAALGRQTYYFSVSGTNLSLKQPVLFFGQLIESTNGAQTNPPTPLAPLPATAAFQRLQSSPASAGLTRRVSGKAIVGNKTEFTVEAVSPSSQPGN